jgi:hypothetical protein
MGALGAQGFLQLHGQGGNPAAYMRHPDSNPLEVEVEHRQSHWIHLLHYPGIHRKIQPFLILIIFFIVYFTLL